MILSCVDGTLPFTPDESITPACSAALFSAGSLFHFNQCRGFRKRLALFLLFVRKRKDLKKQLWLTDTHTHTQSLSVSCSVLFIQARQEYAD